MKKHSRRVWISKWDIRFHGWGNRIKKHYCNLLVKLRWKLQGCICKRSRLKRIKFETRIFNTIPSLDFESAEKANFINTHRNSRLDAKWWNMRFWIIFKGWIRKNRSCRLQNKIALETSILFELDENDFLTVF